MDENKILIKSINNKVEVTALKFYHDNIIAGIGSFLYIFEYKTGRLLERNEIFIGQKIHGFQFLNNSLSIYGGRKICILEINDFKILKKTTEFSINDWILNIYMLNDSELAIITAHNKIIKYSCKSNNIIKKISCEEKCILYYATFVNINDDDNENKWRNLIVLGGTVFQEIIIWSPININDSLRDDDDVDKPILQRLKGHNGVIFNIFYDKTKQSICSTSDDRSVRLWTKTNTNDKLLCINDWKKKEIFHLTHTMFGHNARVWRSFIANDYIISIGEDSQVCIWNINTGKLLNSWKSYQGSRLWSIDCNIEESLIAVGGGDGGISLWPLIDIHNSANFQMIKIPTKHFIVKRLNFIKSNHIIFINDKGELMEYKNNIWNIIYKNKRLANYSLLSLSPLCQLIALADIFGYIYIFNLLENDYKKLRIHYHIHDGKIFSIHWLNEEYILSCGDDGQIFLWKIIFNNKQEYHIKKERKHILPYTKERWLTCALFYNDLLICGDRGGSIYVFHSKEQIPRERFIRQHGSLGVTSICKLNMNIISLGRDGRLCRYTFNKNDNKLEIENSEKLPIKWPIAVYNIKQYKYLITGFSEDRFIAWSANDRRILFDIPCGGGHRAWDLILNESPLQLDFIYIKDSVIHNISYNLNNLALKILLPGLHCHIIHSARIISLENENIHILISTGEDNVIRITTLPDCHSSSYNTILRGHLSAVRTLVIKKISSNNYFLITAGARSEIKTWILHFDQSDINYTELACHMIRDHDYKSAIHLPDPESRYMDLVLTNYQENLFLLTAASSDGIIRFFITGPSKSQLELIGSIDFHKRCILKLKIIELIQETILISMATDGQAVLWHLPSRLDCSTNLQPYLILSLHQSGINACDWIEIINNKNILLATGGDDNALIITLIDLKNNSGEIIYRNNYAHLSQITGIKFLKNENLLITTSIDQRITVWNWQLNNKIFQCDFIKQFCSTVSDIHGFDIWMINKTKIGVCIYGSGIEILDISLNFSTN